jgi:thiol:disulfide interchange protein
MALLLIVVFALRSGSDSPAAAASLESRLDQALKDGRPTCVFLHSLDCIPCKVLMRTVADTYPSFRESVELIDVDVYDERNVNLLRRERLTAIPTLVFYDGQGTRQVVIGVMPPAEFRAMLLSLAESQNYGN